MVASSRTKRTSRTTTTPAATSRVLESSWERLRRRRATRERQRLDVQRRPRLRQVLLDVLEPALELLRLGTLALSGLELTVQVRRPPLGGLGAHERRGQLAFEPHDLVGALDRAGLMRGERLEPHPRVGQLLADPLALGPLLDEPPLERQQMDVRGDPGPRGRGAGVERRGRGGRGDGFGRLRRL